MRMKIGIYGGTFNPIHCSHLETAKNVTEELCLDRLYLMIAADPPHKEVAGHVSARKRLKMAEMATRQEDRIIPSDMEIRRGGKSYTALTLQDFQRFNPGAELFLVVGSDMLKDLPNWFHVEEVLRLATVVSVPRIGFEQDDESHAERLRKEYHARVIRLRKQVRGISSTEIRERLFAGRPVSGLVAPEVEKYIYESGIYFPDSIRQMQRKCRESLNPRRYVHVASVMRRAAELAEKYDVDREKARIAALLHDCAKCMDKQTLFRLSGEEQFNPNVLHAFAGAIIAEKVYGVTDPDVLEAIRLHCTGDENMSRLSMLIYLADMTEQNRSFPAVSEIRAACDISLEKGMLTALRYTMGYLERMHYDIHPATIRALEFFEKKEEAH